jgi:hypothetical protein
MSPGGQPRASRPQRLRELRETQSKNHPNAAEVDRISGRDHSRVSRERAPGCASSPSGLAKGVIPDDTAPTVC